METAGSRGVCSLLLLWAATHTHFNHTAGAVCVCVCLCVCVCVSVCLLFPCKWLGVVHGLPIPSAAEIALRDVQWLAGQTFPETSQGSSRQPRRTASFLVIITRRASFHRCFHRRPDSLHNERQKPPHHSQLPSRRKAVPDLTQPL